MISSTNEKLLGNIFDYASSIIITCLNFRIDFHLMINGLKSVSKALGSTDNIILLFQRFYLYHGHSFYLAGLVSILDYRVLKIFELKLGIMSGTFGSHISLCNLTLVTIGFIV
jgi:hypothetical protein